MIVGCYSLDLYCDNEAGPHKYDEFPAVYTAQTGSKCRRLARKDGWKLDINGGKAACPRCVSFLKGRIKAPHIQVVRVGHDPFGRGETTVFYRDLATDGGRDVFYLWLTHWPSEWPEPPTCEERAALAGEGR